MATLTTSFTKLGEAYLGNSYGNLYIRIYAKYTSQSISNNESYVVYQSRAYYSGNYIISKTPTTVTTRGSSTSDNTTSWESFEGRQDGTFYNGETVLKTLYATVKHNDATGAASISTSATFNAGPWGWSATASGSADLPTIARKTPCPNVTDYIESTANIKLEPKNTAFKHSLKVDFGNISKWLNSVGDLVSNEIILSNHNLPFKIPTDFYNQFTTTYGVGTLTLNTYNGNSKIGSTQASLKAMCNPVLCNPQVLDTVIEDINEKTIALTKNKYNLIKDASIARVIPTLQASDEDDKNTIITQKKVGSTVFTDDSTTVLATDKKFDITLTNSRTLSSTTIVESKGELIPYIPLTFNIVNLYRPEPTTGEVKVVYNGKFFDGEFTSKSKTSNDLFVGDELSYENIICSFPDNLWETIGVVEGKKTILKTNEYELYYWSISTTNGNTYTITLESIINPGNKIDLYIAASYNDSQPTEVQYNSPDLIINTSFGIIEEVDTNDNIVYPYIHKTTVEEAVKNELEIRWEYKKKFEENYTDGGVLTPTVDTEKSTYSGQESLGNVFDYKEQYTIRFYYNDKIVEGYLDGDITRGIPVYWWTADSFHIQGDLYVDDEILSTNSVYSTEEQTVGTWLGKPLYQKTFRLTDIGTQKSLGIDNVETLIIDSGSSYITWNEPNITYPLDRANFEIWIPTTEIKAANEAVKDWQATITVKYTKTTDEPSVSIIGENNEEEVV